MEYETNYNGINYKFIENGSGVVIYEDDEKWGSPQGERFFRLLISDIKQLKEENKKLKNFIEGWEYDLTPEFRKCFPNGLK